jgi:hypothetical protein
MAEANPFDQLETTTPTVEVNPFDEFDKLPEAPSATLESVIEQTTPSGFFDPTAPQDFSLKNVAIGTGIGAGVGTLIGGFPFGTLGGAISGATGTGAGEVSRTMGASPATQITTELIAGGLPSAIKKFGTKALGLVTWKGERLSNMLKSTSDEEFAALVAKEKTFGTPTFKGLYTTKNSDLTQSALKSDLLNSGVQVADDELASVAVRKQLYANMKANNPFVKSTEYAELGDEIAALRARKLISPIEERNLEKILKNQLNTNPKIANTANQDILNLIQNGGTYTVEGQTKAMISPDAQRVLRDQFNKYLERNTGKKGYDYLKGIEQQEFIAASRDSIPTIVATKFTRLDEPYKLALSNIAKSPEGKMEFAKAIDQHFYQLGETIEVAGKQVGKEISPDKLMKEFIRLRPAIEESGVMSRPQLEELTRRISGIPAMADKVIAKKYFTDIMRGAIIGAGASEVSSTKPIIMPM